MSDMDDRYLVITYLLLGAVYADERLEGEETGAVRRLLAKLMEVDEIPEELDEIIEAFDPDDFDLEQAAEAFAADPLITKRNLLELVAAVFDADEVVDFDEDAYMRSLAEALGMEESEYKDLRLSYELEDFAAVARQVVPPPIPKD